jgi:hypothetical protein
VACAIGKMTNEGMSAATRIAFLMRAIKFMFVISEKYHFQSCNRLPLLTLAKRLPDTRRHLLQGRLQAIIRWSGCGR